MSNAVTGLEGMLASRVLGSMADEHEADVISTGPFQREAELAYKKALHAGKRRQHGNLVVTTTVKDERTSSGLATAGSLTLAGRITPVSDLDLIVNVDQVSGGLSAVQYFETVQCMINPTEIVKATLDAMSATFAQSVSDAQKLLASTIADAHKQMASAEWLKDAFQELQDALDDEDAVPLAPDEKAILSELGRSALSEAVSVSVEAPSIDIDPQGNLNLFWKRGAEGLLVVIRSDRTIHFFGSSAGDSFRADYALTGKTWRTHLNFYLQPFISDDAT